MDVENHGRHLREMAFSYNPPFVIKCQLVQVIRDARMMRSSYRTNSDLVGELFPKGRYRIIPENIRTPTDGRKKQRGYVILILIFQEAKKQS